MCPRYVSLLTDWLTWLSRRKATCSTEAVFGQSEVIDSQECLSREALDQAWCMARLYCAKNAFSSQEIGDKIGDKTDSICAKCWARNSGDSRVITVVTNCHILHHTRNASHENRMQKYFSISQENIMRTEYSERTSTIHHTADECWLIIFDVYAHWLSIVGAFSGNGLTRRSEIITK